MNKFFKVAAVAALALAGLTMNACSDSGGGSSTKSAKFVDSAVAGISYKTSSGLEGVTDADGNFSFKSGDTVTFFIGKIELPGGIPQDGIITPAHLAGTADWETDTTAVNIIRFLLTLDEDGNPDNGIQIPKGAADLALEEIDFSDTVVFDAAAQLFFEELEAEIKFEFSSIVDSGAATTHFSATIKDLGIEIEIQIVTTAVPCTSSNTAAIAGDYSVQLVGTINDLLDVTISGTSLTIDTDEPLKSCTFVQSQVTGDVNIVTSTWTWVKDNGNTYTVNSTEGVSTFITTDGSDSGMGLMEEVK